MGVWVLTHQLLITLFRDHETIWTLLELCNEPKTFVATVMTNVFQKNEISLLRKFAKIMIFDKIDDSKNQGLI